MPLILSDGFREAEQEIFVEKMSEKCITMGKNDRDWVDKRSFEETELKNQGGIRENLSKSGNRIFRR